MYQTKLIWTAKSLYGQIGMLYSTRFDLDLESQHRFQPLPGGRLTCYACFFLRGICRGEGGQGQATACSGRAFGVSRWHFYAGGCREEGG